MKHVLNYYFPMLIDSSKELRSNKQACELFKSAGCGEVLELELDGFQDYWKEASHYDLADFVELVKLFNSGFQSIFSCY